MGEARFYLDAFPTWLVLSCSLDYYCDFEPYYVLAIFEPYPVQ